MIRNNGRRFLKLSTGQSGISLTEALFAVLIASIMAVCVSELAILGAKGAQGITSSIQFDNLISQIRILMKGSSVCQQTLQGIPLVPLGAGQNFGDAGTGAPLPAIYKQDTVGTLTPLISAGQGFFNVSNLQMIVYDLGAIDTIAPIGNIHMIGLYVGGDENAGTSVGLTHVSNVLFPTFGVSLDGVTYATCLLGANWDAAQATVVAATGSQIVGSWVVTRYGDLITNPTPRAGTYDLAYGTGQVTGGLPVINGPATFGVWGQTPFNMVSSITTQTWQATAYKLW